jgi:hypothetical protein
MKMTEKGNDLISRSVRNLPEGTWGKKDNLRQVIGIFGQFERSTPKTHIIFTFAIWFPSWS